MATVTEISLERDGHDQPWGFRLQGGKDVDGPLSVQRVLVGTPADGYLKRGDIILKIGSTDVQNLSHQAAADLFMSKKFGNTITVSVNRGANSVGNSKSNISSNSNAKTVKIISRTAFTTIGKLKVVKTYNPLDGWHPDKVSTAHNKSYQATHFPPTDSVKGNSFIKPLQDNMDRSYNNPINLYSTQNVAEVASLNQMGQSPIPSMNRPITPNKPQQVLLSPSKDYNPKESATWQALQESTDSGKINVTNIPVTPNLHEHDPIYATVYAAHRNPQMGESKQNQGLAQANGTLERAPVSPIPNPLSPRPTSAPSINLPPSVFTSSAHPAMNATSAAFSETRTLTPRSTASDRDALPIYETNSISGRKRITQSASFNKLMMDVLGI